MALPGLSFQLAWQFAGGIGIGGLLERCRPILPGTVRLVAMGALLAAALTASLFHHRLYYPRGVSDWTYLGALAFPLVFLAAESGPPVGRIGRALASFLQAQGEASYSAYLYHNVFVVLAYVLVVELRLEGALREAVVYPFVLTGSFIVSHLSYRAVERPGIALGRRLAVGQGRGRATA